AECLPGFEVEQVGHHALNMAMKIRIPVRWRSASRRGRTYVAGPTMEKTMTPVIRYAMGQSSLGPFVAALSERGLALVEFGDVDLQARFPDADLVEDTAALGETVEKLARLFDHPETDVEFALDLQGSPFELKVWQALREIPAGTTVTY